MKSPTTEVAHYFVTEFIGRRWTRADYRSRHMRAAKILLKEMKYSQDAIISALMALKDGDYTQFGYNSPGELPKKIEGMEVLWSWGEPPLMERFLAPPPQPVIYSHDYDDWVRRWGRIAVERGDWDGIYVRQDPTQVEWLEDVLGRKLYRESIKQWQTLQRTTPQRRQSSGT